LAACALLLAGCAGSAAKIKASPQFICVELRQYSKAEQKQMLAELEAHEAEIPAVAAAIDDYGSLRRAIRKVCPRPNP
jgi:hypothetical protein